MTSRTKKIVGADKCISSQTSTCNFLLKYQNPEKKRAETNTWGAPFSNTKRIECVPTSLNLHPDFIAISKSCTALRYLPALTWAAPRLQSTGDNFDLCVAGIGDAHRERMAPQYLEA